MVDNADRRVDVVGELADRLLRACPGFGCW